MAEPVFVRLNAGWNAEPNVPAECVRTSGRELVLSFRLNPWEYKASDGERASLIFLECAKWRLGDTNDEGWYLGQCRYSASAPKWGEFYELVGDDDLRDQPSDWMLLTDLSPLHRHFLFYLRDTTFECLAKDWRFSRAAEGDA